MNKTIIIAPSMLSADFTKILQGIEDIENSQAQAIHLDVMDGNFVPNLTFGPKMISDIRQKTKLLLDVHLMINNPELSIDSYIEAGSDILTFHLEACTHSHRLLQYIKSKNIKAGVSIVPSTPVEILIPILDIVDNILVMTVNPGFGGQELITSCIDKISFLNEYRKKNNLDYMISVDGGINIDTAKPIIKAGADLLVTGSAFFGNDDKERFVKDLMKLNEA